MDWSSNSGFVAVMAFIGISLISGLIGAWTRGGGKKAHTCEVHEQTCEYVQAIDRRQQASENKRETAAAEIKNSIDSICSDLGQLKTDVRVFMAEQKVRNESMQVFGRAIEAFSAVLQQTRNRDE